jgi:hypothetical protein
VSLFCDNLREGAELLSTDNVNSRKDIKEEIPQCRECIARLNGLSNDNKLVNAWLKKYVNIQHVLVRVQASDPCSLY